MKTVDKDAKTHYVHYGEMLFGGVKWLDKFDEGDIVIVTYGNGVTKHYEVAKVKLLKEL